MATPEPGLDEHEWATEMALLEEDLRTSPTEALPQLVDLVGRMLVERGCPPDEPHAQADPELVGGFLHAREVTERLAAGEDGELGDAADAVQRLMRIYDHVMRERRAP